MREEKCWVIHYKGLLLPKGHESILNNKSTFNWQVDKNTLKYLVIIKQNNFVLPLFLSMLVYQTI